MKFTRYDVAAWLTFVAYAGASLAIPIVLVDMAEALHFPLADGGMAQGGSLQLVRSISMCISMTASGILAARFGNRRPLGAAVAVMGAGILMCSLAPSYLVALPMIVVAGLGEGVIEALATPFVQDIHDADQNRYVIFAHGFWSLGTFAVVLGAGGLLAGGVSWRLILAAIAMVSAVPLLLIFLPSRRPYVEKPRNNSDVGSCLRPVLASGPFWLFFAAMFFAGGGEYCLTFWCASFVRINFAASAMMGGIATAVFAIGMFIGRTGFGALVRQRHLKTLISYAGIGGSVVACLIPPFAAHYQSLPPWAGIAGLMLILFLCGVATAPFWPGIQSFTVAALPHLDSTMAFIVLSCAGVPGAGFFTWLMGAVGDNFGLGAAFSLVPACFLIMTLLFLIGDRLSKNFYRV